jgi:hypothetical protein
LFSELTKEERLYGWFQQDSATVHTTHMPMQALSSVFGHRIISNDIWPACSPNLNPHDFFFWGCLKDKIYSLHFTAGGAPVVVKCRAVNASD